MRRLAATSQNLAVVGNMPRITTINILGSLAVVLLYQRRFSASLTSSGTGGIFALILSVVCMFAFHSGYSSR